jgi:transcriptional regulator of acetoin/glycerol metabolism
MIKSPRFTEAQIRAALRREGTVTKAAASLGISRQTLHLYIQHYEINVRRQIVA